MKIAPELMLLLLAACLALPNSSLEASESKTIHLPPHRKLASPESGYISIDCGIEEAYTDRESNIWYQPDSGFVETGQNKKLPSDCNFDNPQMLKQLKTLRSFPDGERNCYTLTPKQGKNRKYIVRAFFAHGNCDLTNSTPSFDVYLGANLWRTIHFSDSTPYFSIEVILVLSDAVSVCLVNTGNGVPFMSSLELWPLSDSIYQISSSSPLDLMTRSTPRRPGDPRFIRFEDDMYGRVWFTRVVNQSNTNNISASIDSSSVDQNTNELPTQVLKTAIESRSRNSSLEIYFDQQTASSYTYCIYLYFFEFEELAKTQKRIINITINDGSITGSVTTQHWKLVLFYKSITKVDQLRISINAAPESDLPAMINAFEVYRKLNLPDQDLCLAGSCKTKKSLVPLIASIAASIAVLVMIVLIFLMIRRIRRKKQGASKKEGQEKSKNQAFSFSEVTRITSNFKTVVGKGGFGEVYLGTLQDGREVAVKLLSQASRQGYREFQSEANLLTVVHHKNLVSFVGYCEEGDMKALIYEYMAKGNLQQLLSDKNPNILKWYERLQIAMDIALGLDYLHNGIKPSIVHRDLKTTNILLNENMQAKIADFGLCRSFADENDSHISTIPAGTLGYLDPEFRSSGNLTRKSDIYSFGIILLELITGQPAMKQESLGCKRQILDWVNPKLNNGDIESIVDPRLEGQYNRSSAWKLVEIAMSCVPSVAIQRPDISEVLAELKDCLALENLRERSENSIRRSNNSVDMASLNSLQLESTAGPYAR